MTIYFPLVVHGAMMIEPTESEGRDELDLFIDSMKSIAREAEENPELGKQAPHDTRIGQLDEAAAARKPVLRWKPASNDAGAWPNPSAVDHSYQPKFKKNKIGIAPLHAGLILLSAQHEKRARIPQSLRGKPHSPRLKTASDFTMRRLRQQVGGKTGTLMVAVV